ncbi:unnamed protein product [Cyprideis torosa]|uniref:Uncharacterized protein n=1 Tax=Cyprideis torosa TaxID=163714 RepID=A0A7R8ZRA7_9CRUS|nr:unnamed protein product [Cyprideis torosa]CAG0892555.1 unnamed protein product [Cyprideis torosa]
MRIPLEKCSETSLPSLLQASLVHSKNGGHHMDHHADQTAHDIFLYVLIMVAFYAVIALVIYAARTLQRRAEEDNRWKKMRCSSKDLLVVYDESNRQAFHSIDDNGETIDDMDRGEDV